MKGLILSFTFSKDNLKVRLTKCQLTKKKILTNTKKMSTQYLDYKFY